MSRLWLMSSFAVLMIILAKSEVVQTIPYSNYSSGMAYEKGKASEWQKDNRMAIDRVTAVNAVATCVSNEAAADKLLSKLKGAYETDSVAAVQIAAISQFVMDKSQMKSRCLWTHALVRKMQSAEDAYVRQFCLEQLRCCGTVEQVPFLRNMMSEDPSPAVRDMAEIVSVELAADKSRRSLLTVGIVTDTLHGK